MKRIIKFRGKDISQDIWYEGSLYQDELVSSIMFQHDGVDYDREVDAETVCQFTGLKDKNGNEIFENDIVGKYGYLENKNKIVETGVVKWFNDKSCFSFDKKGIWNLGIYITSERNNLEGLGNIYETPSESISI